MSKKFLTLLALSLLVSGPDCYLHADYPSMEAYESKTVGEITIEMENLAPGTAFDPKTVLYRLKTKVGDPFSQLTFDEDLKTLASEYDRIEPTFQVDGPTIDIKLKVWARPEIRSIKWSGNEHISTKTLRGELDIKSHSVFNRPKFNKAFNKIKEYYIKKGYFEAEISYMVVPVPDTNEVDIEITIREGRAGRVDDIVFIGFTPKEKDELLAMVITKKYSLFTSWLTGDGTYREEALDQDKLIIVNYLQNEGYADAKVDIKIVEVPEADKIMIEICVDHGPLYHFGKVTFEGNCLFTDAEIEQRFLARPEGAYSPEKLRDSAQAIKDLYGRKGHIEASVQYDTQLDEDKPLYNVHFLIDEGEEFKIGLVRILGNSTTKSHVILRESHLVPGETFDMAKLKATQARLENIGYFKTVNVYAVRAQDDQSLGSNYRDVYIEVEEMPTGHLSLFGGLSSSQDVFGGLDLTETNFNYRGISKIFDKGFPALRGGGEYAHLRFTAGERQRSYLGSWMNPYFRDTLWRIGFEVSKNWSDLQTKHYSVNTVGFTAFASYPLTPYWTFGTKYRVRYNKTHVSHHNTTHTEQDLSKTNGVLSGISSSIGFDNTDSSQKPHNGLRSLLDAEFVGLGGKYSFFRLGYVNTLYTALWSRGIMKYRADFRFIEPLSWKCPRVSDIPISERFFLGGESTVRGYVPWSLGPHFDKKGAQKHHVTNGDPTGGISSSLLSIEYNQEIFSMLDLFVFADAGMVSLQKFVFDEYRFSWGYGARIQLMNRMPIVVGVGYPINPERKRDVERVFFSMGGQF